MRVTRLELCGELSRRAGIAVRGINAKTFIRGGDGRDAKSALSANNRIVDAAEIEKYRVKSAQTSILNCCRGPFAEGAGITAAIQGRHERIGPGYNGSLIGQFCR